MVCPVQLLESLRVAAFGPAEQKRILLTMDKLPEMRRDLQRIKNHLGLKDEDRGSRVDDGESKKQAG